MRKGQKLSMDKISLATQNTYRTILQSMCHPGRVYHLFCECSERSELESSLPCPISPEGLFSVLLTLMDNEVSFFIYGDEAVHMEVAICEATGSAATGIASADFIIIPGGKSCGELLKAKSGSVEYPDTGATAIFVIDTLENRNNGGNNVVLKGPGIEDYIEMSAGPLLKGEFSRIKEVNAEFPLGIDCIFIDKSDRIMCIPRSTVIEVN
jgi:alpha-D-ribose 1-methylphosphonate 5-triphosphate synthase subunit PhnH